MTYMLVSTAMIEYTKNIVLKIKDVASNIKFYVIKTKT